jgi:formylmethanofuran dehydrogenase subunit E
MTTRRLLLASTLAAPLLLAHEDDTDPSLSITAMIHGGSGPFAVAGYRIGQAGLRALKLPRLSFDLEVIHHCPREVQWTCIIDGLQAATGASLGKLNLSLVPSTKANMMSVLRNRKTKQEVRYTLTPEFIAKYLDTPMTKLASAGAEVATLPEKSILRTLP